MGETDIYVSMNNGICFVWNSSMNAYKTSVCCVKQYLKVTLLMPQAKKILCLSTLTIHVEEGICLPTEKLSATVSIR